MNVRRGGRARRAHPRAARRWYGRSRFVGDLNSEPGEAPYEAITDLLADAWAARGRGPGASCCQLPTLTNPESILDERIDLVLFSEASFDVKRVELVGDAPLDPALELAAAIAPYPYADPPLPGFAAGTPMYWASDHAGIVAELRFAKP